MKKVSSVFVKKLSVPPLYDETELGVLFLKIRKFLDIKENYQGLSMVSSMNLKKIWNNSSLWIRENFSNP